MHLKVVNSTNINDPLTIFESQQFQNRQTDSQKQQQVVCMHFQTLADVYIMSWKWLFNMTGLSPPSMWPDRIKQYTAQVAPQLQLHDMTQVSDVAIHTFKIQYEVEKWPGVVLSVLICFFS